MSSTQKKNSLSRETGDPIRTEKEQSLTGEGAQAPNILLGAGLAHVIMMNSHMTHKEIST